MITKIISGGQTGADRAALDFAIEKGIDCGGYCPKGRIAEDGVIPAKYPLREAESEDPSERTVRNVAESEGTLVFTLGAPSGGTALTIDAAEHLEKPWFVFDFHKPFPNEVVASWMKQNQIHVLNIAGPRESEAPGIYTSTLKWLSDNLGK